jgi:hypothetical protein
MPVDKQGKVTRNDNDTYLRGKYKTEVYRYNSNTLAIQFNTKPSVKTVIPKLSELGVTTTLFVQGDFESVYLFPEKDLDKVNNILKFKTSGARISPKSKRTIKQVQKNAIKRVKSNKKLSNDKLV